MAVLTLAEDSTDSAQVGLMRTELQLGLNLAKIATEPVAYSPEHRERAIGNAQKAYDSVLTELKKVALLSPEDELCIGQKLEELRRKLKALASNRQNNQDLIS
jgi:uncharacterized membrane protein